MTLQVEVEIKKADYDRYLKLKRKNKSITLEGIIKSGIKKLK